MVGGFTGKKLEVDLTTQTIKTTSVTDDEIKTYIGGKALSVKWLWDRLKRGTDPLSPGAVLIIDAGPLGGLPPIAGVTHAVAKSPLTGHMGEGTSNGYFAGELKNAGYDAIIFTGKAASPVYLYIRDDVVELRDAKDLWGKGCGETVGTLNDRLNVEMNGRPAYHCCLTIGQGGEKLVRWAAILQGAYHCASHQGMGAVMGSKNLKAIAVRGTKPIPLANKAEYYKLVDECIEWSKSNVMRTVYLSRRWAALSCLINAYRGTQSVKNEQETDGPEYDQKKGVASTSKLMVELPWNTWRDSCRNCWKGCGANSMHKWVIRSGKYAGTVCQGKSDNLGSRGSSQLYTDMDGRVYLSALDDEWGLNGVDSGVMIAWAMEAHEKGILSTADLGGIDLKWGDIDGSAKLMAKIVRREGIGNILAEGPKYGIAKQWPDSMKYCMVVQGTGQGVGQKSFRPKVRTHTYTASNSGALFGGLGGPLNEAVGWCSSGGTLLPKGDLTRMAMWKAATGFDLYQTTEAIADFILKIRVLERSFAIREGKVPLTDEKVPDRMLADKSPVTYGHGKAAQDRGEYCTSTEFPELMQKVYKDSLASDTKGYPTRANLTRLGLDFVIPVFEEMRVWG